MSTSTEDPVFLGVDPELAKPEKAFAVILPVRYDATSTWIKGAEKGPDAIIAASHEVELYDIMTDSEPYTRGIATLPGITLDGDPETMTAEVERAVNTILDRNQLPVVLGGEHSVSIGAIFATTNRYQNCTVLQIDAHGDTRDSYGGSKFNHACVMARAKERSPVVQVGIRAIDASERANLEPERTFYAHDIMQDQTRSWMDGVVDLLSNEVYMTIDLDAFDPAYVPATGTPEPGGLDWYTVNELIRRVTLKRRIVGFDVVELAPQPGEHASAFLAAKLVYRILAMISVAS